MKPPGQPTRRSVPRSKKRPRGRNPERAARNLERAYGPEERREWIRSLPSVVSGEGPCVNAHVGTGGTGHKAGYEKIVPLTDLEHRELDGQLVPGGRETFEQKYRIDLDAAAANIEARWQVIVANQEPLPW